MRFGIGIVSVFLAASVLISANAPTSGNTPVPVVATHQIHTYSPIVTGNGFGYAVVDTTGEVIKFFAHPYRYERPNPDVSKDGFDTPNFVKSISFGSKAAGSGDVRYVSESHVIASKRGGVEEAFFLPFGLKHNALVATRRTPVTAGDAGLKVVWEHPIQHDEVKDISGRKVRLLSFRDVKESLALVPLDASAASASAGQEVLPGQAWAFVVVEKPEDFDKAVKEVLQWHGDQSVDAVINNELKNMEAWRVKPPVQFASEKEHRLWRQNETILRMAQIQEENNSSRYNHGLILASLPNGVWFTPWVRDMSYALVGLVRMGHKDEAREGILSWFNARPVGRWKHEVRNMDYQISVVRYYGDGSEEADYSGQKTPNVEYDDWGLALWAISEYFDKTHDDSLLSTQTYRGGNVYETMRDYIVKPLLGNLDPYEGGLIVTEDSSCWEEHQENKRHYACSTIAAIPGLRGFQKIAEHMHDEATVQLVAGKLKLLEEGFKKAFVKDGAVNGVLEVKTQPKSEVDGAVLETFNMGIINDPSVMEKTIKRLEQLKTASGGYRRNTGPSDYEAHEFLFIDFNLARAYQRLGKTAEAARLLDVIVDKSLEDNGLIPEMYVSAKNRGSSGEIGDPAGAIPMVGFGAGAYAITLSERK